MGANRRGARSSLIHSPPSGKRGTVRTLRAYVAIGTAIVLAGCAGRAPQPVAVIQPQDRFTDCAAIAVEVQANNIKIQELAGEESEKVAQNLAAGVAGLFIWPLWFGMDFQGAASTETSALQSRQEYLGTLASQKNCRASGAGVAQYPPASAGAPAPAATPMPAAALLPAPAGAAPAPAAAGGANHHGLRLATARPPGGRAAAGARGAIPGDDPESLLPAEHLRERAMTERARFLRRAPQRADLRSYRGSPALSLREKRQSHGLMPRNFRSEDIKRSRFPLMLHTYR